MERTQDAENDLQEQTGWNEGSGLFEHGGSWLLRASSFDAIDGLSAGFPSMERRPREKYIRTNKARRQRQVESRRPGVREITMAEGSDNDR